ncbi:arsenate reductase ArsC [Roseibium sp.]|uniref:arsenate reductase ArsC n=1 Tax=Roseibium sp. TaxID=1936156 RepID=UPI003BB178D0
MNDDTYNILFLCTRNAARSVMAEAIVNRQGYGRFQAFSAGTNPAREVRPEVVRLLQRMDCNVEAAYAKSLTELIGSNMPELDFMITICDQDREKTCPVWPGHPTTALWPLPDPGAHRANGSASETDYAETFRCLSEGLASFMSLPKDQLDRMSLRNSLDTFHRMH